MVIGSAIVYVRRNPPVAAKATDVIVAGGSFMDLAEVKEIGKDIKRCAHALEQMANIHVEQSQEEELEDKMVRLLERLEQKKRRKVREDNA